MSEEEIKAIKQKVITWQNEYDRLEYQDYFDNYHLSSHGKLIVRSNIAAIIRDLKYLAAMSELVKPVEVGEMILNGLIKDFKSPLENAFTYEYDSHGGSTRFINEAIVNLLIEKISLPSAPVKPSIQSGVEEAAKEHAEGKSTERFVCTVSNIKSNALNDFKAGAEWQAQQVKREAGRMEAILLDYEKKFDNYSKTIAFVQEVINKEKPFSLVHHLPDIFAEKNKAIEQLQVKQPVMQWVSVKDDLPAESCILLVYRSKCRTEIATYIQDDNCIKRFYDGNRREIISVTHWAKLPEPPIQ